MENIVEIIFLLLSLLCLSQTHHLGERTHTTTQISMSSPRRVRMNTQSLQGQKSINVRQTSGSRPLLQNPKRGSHIIPPSVTLKRTQGRQLPQRNPVASRNSAQVTSNRNQHVRLTNSRTTQNRIGTSRGKIVRGNGQPTTRLQRGPLSSQLQNQNQKVRHLQTKRIPSNTATTRMAPRRGSIIRGGHSSMISPSRNAGSIRSNSMTQGQNSNRGEFKKGATTQIRIRTQTDTSKLPLKDINRNSPIITRNPERGMWKNVPAAPRSVSLGQLKSQTRNSLNQVPSILGQPLINQGGSASNLANSKNRMSTIKLAPNVIPANGGNVVLGSASIGGATNGVQFGVVQGHGATNGVHSGVVQGHGATNGVQSGVVQGHGATNGVQSGVVQGHGTNKMIALELNLSAAPKSKTAPIVKNVQPATELSVGSSTGVATPGLSIASTSTGSATTTNAASRPVIQIQKVHSGITPGGKKKMSLTLSSGQSGGPPIVIEALGNIVLSQEKLPDGRLQFVIKADPPTSASTGTPNTKTTNSATKVTTATSTATVPPTTTVTIPPTTTTIPPTTTAIPPSTTIFMEETEMPEPGEFTVPPSGLGTTEPM